MSFFYRFFGFSAACNIPIPGLIPSESYQPDLRILLGFAPQQSADGNETERLIFTSTIITESGDPAFRILKSEHMFHIMYHDGVQFWLHTGEGDVWATWPPKLTVENIAPYLLGPVLGLLLRFRGIVCLHAGAVIVSGRAAVFAGDSGAGKSTTVAAMMRRGHPLLTDDIVAIAQRGSGFFVPSAFPFASLWPDSIAMIGAERLAASLSIETPKLRLQADAFAASEAPLGVIFVLGGRENSLHAPRVSDLTQHERMTALIGNSYGTLVLDQNEHATEFEFFGRLIANVPIRALVLSSDPNLPSMCGLIERECSHLFPSDAAERRH